MGAADAVVIGAGHNGLVAANLLADAGWDVQVLEATGSPGGAVRSGTVTASGYLSDLFSAFYPLGIASPILGSLGLGEYGLRWRHAPDVLAHLLPDGRAAVLNRAPDRTAESVGQFAPGDDERWLAAYEQWLQVSDGMLSALFTGFPPVRAGASLLRTLRLPGALRMARRVLLPARFLADELYRGEGAQLLLEGCALHTNLSPHDVGGGIYGWLLTGLGQQYGFPVPEGGAYKITAALVARLRARGGRIEYGATAERVAVIGGAAAGVLTADGRRWQARRAVLADVPAPVLYLSLVGERYLPPTLVDDLDHFRWDGSTVKIDWALSAPVPWRNPAVAGAGTVHLGVDRAGMDRYSADLTRDAVPERPFVLTGQMTTADPSRSPAGTESMWAYTHLPHRPAWSTQDVLEHVDRIEAIMEEAAPGFAALVLGRHVAGPADLERDNPSLVGGAIGGGTSAAYQQLFLRPVPGLGRADTPVDRLYLASSSAHPGGGVHGGPGANAARSALARHRPLAGALYRATIAAAHRGVYGADRR
jgi:phytoene dehydrogenase-like protein